MKKREEEYGQEAFYLLEYEKKKMQEYAGSLNSLAAIFLMKPQAKEEVDRQTLLQERRKEEDRCLFGGQLKQMAEVIEKTSRESVQIIRLEKKKEKKMARMLSLEGLILEEFYLLEKEDGRREAVVSLRRGRGKSGKKVCSDEEVAGYLSVLLNMHLIPCGRPPFFVAEKTQTMYFQEENHYMVLSGFAKAIKEGEKVSGDNHRFFESADGWFCTGLSDGMGSGEKACKDSELIMDMAERFISTGFAPEMALQLINDTLIMGGENRNMSTMDFCRINLYTGEVELIKVGAAATFLKQGEQIEEITCDGLPLGVFSRLEPITQTRMLQDGDYIIMCSDGITDCLQSPEQKEEFRKRMVKIPYCRPGQMANYLLESVIRLAKGRIRDDMTILVIGVWENEKGYDTIHT